MLLLLLNTSHVQSTLPNADRLKIHDYTAYDVRVRTPVYRERALLESPVLTQTYTV